MIKTIQGEQPFQVLASNFSIGPSNEGYTLQISADGSNYSDLFSVGSGVTRMVTGVANGSYYRLYGNDSEVSINWRTQCSDGGGSGDIPIASQSTLGGIKVGSGLSITQDGVLSSTGGGGDMSAYWTSAETKSYVDAEISGATPDMSAYWTSGETKSYVDDEISGVTEDLSGLDERVTNIEDTMEEKEQVISRALNDLNDRKVNGDGITNIVSISQSDYDNLSEYDPSTLYIINNN